MAPFLRSALAAIAVAAIAAAASATFGVWLIVHDDVARFRAIERANPTPPPLLLVTAIVATEGWACPESIEPAARFSGRNASLRKCEGRIAYLLVRSASPPRRTLHRQLVTIVKAQVVAWWFTPEELWRIYAHEVYLGSIGSRQVLGVEEASQLYFGKSANALTLPEAATLAAMTRSPNALSPFRHPERALERRNLVLHRMLDGAFISQEDYEQAISSPLGTTNDHTATKPSVGRAQPVLLRLSGSAPEL